MSADSKVLELADDTAHPKSPPSAPWVQLRKMIPGEDVAPKDGAI